MLPLEVPVDVARARADSRSRSTVPRPARAAASADDSAVLGAEVLESAHAFSPSARIAVVLVAERVRHGDADLAREG